MIALRMALALAAASASLMAGAWAGGAFASTGGSAAGRPAGEIPVGDDLEVSGQPMRLSLFYTADPPGRVIAFYADAFRARGLLPVRSAPWQATHSCPYSVWPSGTPFSARVGWNCKLHAISVALR